MGCDYGKSKKLFLFPTLFSSSLKLWAKPQMSLNAEKSPFGQDNAPLFASKAKINALRRRPGVKKK